MNSCRKRSCCSRSAASWLKDRASERTSRGPVSSSRTSYSPAASLAAPSETRITGRAIQRASVRVLVHRVLQLLPAQHAAARADERREQAKLRGGQADLPAAHPHLTAAEVDGEVGVMKDRVPAVVRPRPSQDRLDARDQLRR